MTNSTDPYELEQQAVERIRDSRDSIDAELSKVIIGQKDVIQELLICLFAGGHCLITGAPGLAKTLMVRSMAEIFHLRFQRIQFTPDLMPADITGTEILEETAGGHRQMQFVKGPIFANVVLADEINRTPPKTQAALLEAMQEHQVTAAGVRYSLEEPFFVLATQNPIEMEGTYPLPEAQLDRFMFKILVGSPTLENLGVILDRTTGAETPQPGKVVEREQLLAMRDLVREVPVAEHVKDYIGRVVLATHPQGEIEVADAQRYIRYGASPRAAQAIILASKVGALRQGRYNVAFSDVRRAASPALRHRIILNFEGEAEGIAPDRLVEQILQAVPETAPV